MENNDAVDNGDDMDMGDLGDGNLGTSGDNGDTGDWDMVNEQSGGSDQDVQDHSADQGADPGMPDQQQIGQGPPMQQTGQSANNTPGGGGDFDMVHDFDDNTMDTAGDALADYNVDDDLNLDDSAFGDAFHHNQQDMS